ncbi:MAG: ABC transporter [Fluviicola sp.]|nr:MAG: ABC transporter [Fluviicola sp.]
MFKIFHAILKELRLLKRDIVGFAIIFLMPVVLIITITSIQNSVEEGQNNIQLPILLANNDDGELSSNIISDLKSNGNYQIITSLEDKKLTEEQGRALIKSGDYKILIVIPESFSEFIDEQTNKQVENLLNQVMPSENETVPLASSEKAKEVKIYFDPALRESFTSNIKRSIEGMVSELEKNTIYKSFEKELGANIDFFGSENLIKFTETSINLDKGGVKPNAVEHNLPSWTLFAIFFIVIPLSINLVKEKNQGTYIRLRTLPISKFQLMMSKIIVYLVVCMIQFFLMLLVGIYLFPAMGLPNLNIDGKLFNMSIVALFAGLAAIGFGVLIGTIAKTHEQAAPFGATSVVILAAVGGLWFPVFAMPESMQMMAKISPMNWGLEGFYDVLLRDVGLFALVPNLLLLLTFFIINITIAVAYEKKTNQV